MSDEPTIVDAITDAFRGAPFGFNTAGGSVSANQPTPPERQVWKHRVGDLYQAVCYYPQGSLGEWSHEVVWNGFVQPTRALAWRQGCRHTDSDDFNIAVIRRRRVVAWLWNTEVIDEDEAFLDSMTKELLS